MAEKREAKPEEQEKVIPVFTVLKNNAILKNIFLLDNPPSFPELKLIEPVENGDPPFQEFEETLLVGRHPDCNITLEHPSISRFHLRIHSKPSSRMLSIIDLSSIHGTWVLGKKIEPGVRVELNEGDTMQLGGSSRVYKLHWVPLSRAYDSENPFVSPSDVSIQVEGEEQDENCLFLENNRVQSLDDESEGMDSAFSDENSMSLLSNAMLPSAPPLPEYINSPSFSDEVDNKRTTKTDNEHVEISCLWSGKLATESIGVFFKTEHQQFEKDNESPQPFVASEVQSEINYPKTYTGGSEQTLNLLESLSLSSFYHDQMENKCSLIEDLDQRKIRSFFPQPQADESANPSLTSEIVNSRINDQQLEEENQTTEPLSGTGGLCGIENLGITPVRSEQKSSLAECLNSSSLDEEEEEGHQIAEVLQIVEKKNRLKKDYEGRETILVQSGPPLAAESVNSPSLTGGSVLSGVEIQQLNESNQSCPHTPFVTGGSRKKKSESPLMKLEQKSDLPSIWSRRGRPSGVLEIQTFRSRGKSKGADINTEIEVSQEDIENNAISKALFTSLDGDEEVFTPDKENSTPKSLILRSMKSMAKVQQNKGSTSCRSASLKNKAISEALFMGSDGVEEPFTPDKENFTPNTLLLRTMKKMSEVEEIKHPMLHISSSLENAVNQNIHLEEDILAPSVKEKPTSKVLQERKSLRPPSRNKKNSETEVMAMKTRTKRVPFQPLFANSSGMSDPEASALSATMKSCNSVNYVQTIEENNSVEVGKKRWNMVVDTTCLLNKESRKALQLLQGLKGTQLIIPRIVIRELGCMKQRGSFFRRKTEVSSALQWIEDCMVNSNWWIHVQSSEEEQRPIAPTPPASPQKRFSEGKCGLSGGPASARHFSAWGSLVEIVSPTTEDHILECALLFRRNKNDGKLILLTNDVTLKIKAMAEGLLCESAEEFRESLVNPFSERFLWTESSPRGPTWSCEDDVVLREKYYCCHLRKPSKSGDGAKGLKLILLHNSRYAQPCELKTS
ncbi:hypothetical protein U1Q18_036995 [Sarracenia purpurea var. burkii]